MTYFDQYESFYKDKQGFFAQDNSPKTAQERAGNDEHNYRFLAKNRLLIEQEFNQMFASLEKNGADRKEFWLYCYYCCTMLKNYYIAYNKRKPGQAENYNAQIAKYTALSNKILSCYKAGKFISDPVDARSLLEKIAADLGKLASTPKHTSQIRDWLGFANIYRILFVFSRLATRQSLLLARDLHWIEKLDQIFGKHTDVNKMVANINAPTNIFNALSVGFFAARFILNTGLLLKHTFAPTEQEQLLSMGERLYQEFSKRYCVELNDVVWGMVNGVTNYADFFKISAPVAGWATAAFLVFDVSLLIYRRHLAEQEYLLKRAQYEGEKIHYKDRIQKATTLLEIQKYQKHYDMLEEQIKQLDDSWRATSATYIFNVAAAALLMGGFSASLLLAMPAGVVVGYLLCTVAVAMYLSADTYGVYKEKSLISQRCERESRQGIRALQDADAARNDFIFVMVKNTVMPFLIVTTFAVCWQAALLLTIVYIGYENCRGYFKQPPKNAPELDEVDARLMAPS